MQVKSILRQLLLLLQLFKIRKKLQNLLCSSRILSIRKPSTDIRFLSKKQFSWPDAFQKQKDNSGFSSNIIKMLKAYFGNYLAYGLGALLLFSYSGMNTPSRNVALCDSAREPLSKFRVYKVIGDGSCLFRSVAAGYSFLRGTFKHADQDKLSKELRQKSVDELLKRKDEVKWFIEGDFETYAKTMRKRRTWGGETEILMLTHVLKYPITVYMPGKREFIKIAEYGHEYAKSSVKSDICDDVVPIKVLFHGHGHYELMRDKDAASADSAEWLKSKL